MVLVPSRADHRDRVRRPRTQILVIPTSRSVRYRDQQEVVRLKDETIRAIIKNGTEIAEVKDAVARQLKYVQGIIEGTNYGSYQVRHEPVTGDQ